MTPVFPPHSPLSSRSQRKWLYWSTCVFDSYVNGIVHDSFFPISWPSTFFFWDSYMLMHMVTVLFFSVLHSISSYKFPTTECQEATTSVRWNVLRRYLWNFPEFTKRFANLRCWWHVSSWNVHQFGLFYTNFFLIVAVSFRYIMQSIFLTFFMCLGNYIFAY